MQLLELSVSISVLLSLLSHWVAHFSLSHFHTFNMSTGGPLVGDASVVAATGPAVNIAAVKDALGELLRDAPAF